MMRADESSAPDRTPIALVNGRDLLKLLVENNIGVTTRTTQILELDEAGLYSTEAETPEAADTGADVAKPTLTNGYVGAKSLSMWPLPGGRHAWKASLETILHYVAERAPTVQEATAWIYRKVRVRLQARRWLGGT